MKRAKKSHGSQYIKPEQEESVRKVLAALRGGDLVSELLESRGLDRSGKDGLLRCTD